MVGEVLRASLVLGLVLATPVVSAAPAELGPALKDPFASDLATPAREAPRGDLRDPFTATAPSTTRAPPAARHSLGLRDPFAPSDRSATPGPPAELGLRDPFLQRPASEHADGVPHDAAGDLRDPWADPQPSGDRRDPIQPATAGSADLVDPWALPLHR